MQEINILSTKEQKKAFSRWFMADWRNTTSVSKSDYKINSEYYGFSCRPPSGKLLKFAVVSDYQYVNITS
jgi:hypothetical protein